VGKKMMVIKMAMHKTIDYLAQRAVLFIAGSMTGLSGFFFP
jgi:hypothetical protein